MQMAARRAIGGRDEVVGGRVVNSKSRWSFLQCLTSIHFLVQEKSFVMQLNICVKGSVDEELEGWWSHDDG